ncbi:MAG: RluA family pseudouridine synthase [Anaerolineales bacterium]|nr:RluA family pseudouridine synthase [Anaerolineales bacterium]
MRAALTAIPILWVDEFLLAINKPTGLRTLPDGYDASLPHVKSLLQAEFGALWIVHRLDKDTSGVLVLARTADAHRSLNTQFEQQQTSKCYHALVHGNPGWEMTLVSMALRVNGDRKHRTVVDERKGKPAITQLRVLERLGNAALLEAIPKTGRTHQIRAHLAALGLPVIGDTLYRSRSLEGSAQIEGDLPRLMLHARELEIDHPASGEHMAIEAPYPADFQACLEQLRRARAESESN